jgi:hypothetical protein
MHPLGLAVFLNVAATVPEAMGMVDAEYMVAVVDTMDTVEAVEPETATKVCAPIATLTAILQMYTGSGNALRREEAFDEMNSAFASIAGSPAMSKSIASPTTM